MPDNRPDNELALGSFETLAGQLYQLSNRHLNAPDPPGHMIMNMGHGPVAVPSIGPNGERLTASQALLQYQQRQNALAVPPTYTLVPVEHDPFATSVTAVDHDPFEVKE